LKDYKEIKIKNIRKIVFFAIRTKVKRDVERKCKDRNKEGEKRRRFRIEK
jgi:hypothetical protein